MFKPTTAALCWPQIIARAICGQPLTGVGQPHTEGCAHPGTEWASVGQSMVLCHGTALSVSIQAALEPLQAVNTFQGNQAGVHSQHGIWAFCVMTTSQCQKTERSMECLQSNIPQVWRADTRLQHCTWVLHWKFSKVVSRVIKVRQLFGEQSLAPFTSCF